MVNQVASENGLAPVARCVELLAGDLDLVVGTPETDPVAGSERAKHIGPILWQRGDAVLPSWVESLTPDRPVIWDYSGNPRYAGVPTPIDSIAVIRAAIAALGDTPMQVVLTTGYQQIPPEFHDLPSNFHHAAYLSGPAMAARCDLLVHHGGHSSVMTGLAAGTPAVILPTISERKSNARRVASLGAGEVVLPTEGPDGEPKYRQAAQRVADAMRDLGGITEAADRIERLAI